MGGGGGEVVDQHLTTKKKLISLSVSPYSKVYPCEQYRTMHDKKYLLILKLHMSFTK